jgi:spermidine synthase
MALLFSVTLFVSAGLLFSVQPMIGKIILPRLGGTPAVWNTCMVFFQATLLLGYAYAHFLTRLGIRRQALIHFGLILLPLFVLPIQVSSKAIMTIPNENNPIPWLIGFLVVAMGLPFFAVSTTAPLLQKWFSNTRHHRAHDPYFLYSASNAGSMIGLLSYPLLVEPRLSLMEQSWLWAAGYGCLVALIACSALALWYLKHGAAAVNENIGLNHREESSLPATTEKQIAKNNNLLDGGGVQWQRGEDSISYPRLLRWVLFAFLPSSLLLGVTTYLTTDIAPFPLLWVVPLAIYLLTFILVFARKPVLPPRWLGRALSMSAIVLIIAFITGANHPAWLMTILNLLLFGAAAMIFHGELAKDRPAPSRLTEFYLCISIGGVLGGLFNALVAPILFQTVTEYPLVMLLACAFRPAGDLTDVSDAKLTIRWRDAAWAIGIGLLTAGLILSVQAFRLNPGRLSTLCIFGIPALMTYRFVRNPMRFGFSLMAILAAGLLYTSAYGRTLMVERNFFGVLRVTQDAEGKYHQLFHGNTMHGRQTIDPLRQGEALSYFYRTGPIGQVFDIFNTSSKTSVGIIGLGAGSLTAYARPTQDWTYYEINPAVERIARNPNFFTFLKNSRARSLNVILGDARLRLKEAHDQQYDLFVLDAFSSDSIPMHLITSEALRLYLEKLANGGILAFHITNRRLDLKPVFANLAHDADLIGLIRDDSQVNIADIIGGKEGSVWVVMARHKDDVAPLVNDSRWQQLRPDPRVGVWTDDFSNILSVIRWRQ